ncbi:hypothetical protein C7H62_2533 [Mesoflavibacter sp. HG96]|uniref:BatA domain-containing protein n=1 Tax=Mesoflavibacter TaxID=444051 RepID=UPI000D0E7977|nr:MULTISPECIES: BatA domain-containing protein [Mesoflavibacter]QIJ90341.1 hypothetical protein C7H62_2533 [Mesoflavibacter sp. HG96]QIJ93069.1 hypothetical protein C7H56_2533 [Mesoflavibacter sp. HG37]
MQFKNPELLYALFLLLIPIIVHLFQLRKFKTEYFTNVALLKRVQLQTRKSAKIKKWLTLLTRLLILSAIIIAFAQPFFSKTNAFKVKEETIIYLDNSFSMQAKGEHGALLKRAVNDLLNTIEDDQNFSLITNTSTYKNTTIKAIKNDLLELDYSSNQLEYKTALLKSSQLFTKQENTLKHLVFISDFQNKGTEFPVLKDSIISLNKVVLKPVNKSNTLIDSLFISKRTANNIQLTAVVKNNSKTAEVIPVSLYDNETLISKISVDLNSTNNAVFTLPTNKTIEGKITIEDANLAFDNTLYFSITKPTKINVLAVGTDTKYLKGIFTEDEFNFSTLTTNNLDYALFDNQQLIILNELESLPSTLITALKDFTDKGKIVVFIPSNNGNIADYNSFLQRFNASTFNTLNKQEKRITSINYAHPIYSDGVFEKQVTNFQYPKVNVYFKHQNNSNLKILQFENGQSFLSQKENLFIFNAPLNKDNSNFKNINLIVPTFYNIAKQSLNTSNLYYTIGQLNTFDVAVNLNKDAVLKIENNNQSFIPQQRYFNNKVSITTTDLPEIAGNYQVKNNTEILDLVSYNYDRNESNLTYLNLKNNSNSNISNTIEQAFNTIKNETKVNELWKWFVILALVFLIIEMLILKYFK